MEAAATGAWQPALAGSPPNPGGVCEERRCNGGRTLSSHSAWCFPSVASALPPRAFLVAECLPLLLSGCLSTGKSSALSGSALQTAHSSAQAWRAPTPISCGCAGPRHGPPAQVSLCPVCRRPAAGLASESPRLLFGHPPAGEGTHLDAGTSPHR